MTRNPDGRGLQYHPDPTEVPKPSQAEVMRPTDELVLHIQNAFEAAERHRSTVNLTNRMLADRRQRQGEYEPTRLADIQSDGGSELFFNITEVKCSSAVSWIEETIGLQRDWWDLEPTPQPDLPNEIKNRIRERIVQQFQAEMAEGIQPQARDVLAETRKLMDEYVKEEYEIADQRAKRMKKKMMDQLTESGFRREFVHFLEMLTTFPAAFLKGPVVKKLKRTKWEDGELKIIEELTPTWQAVSPHDMYPGPNARHLQESYLCETVTMDRQDLAEMIGVPGWIEREIKLVLAEEAIKMAIQSLSGESERRGLENRAESVIEEKPDSQLMGVEFWGAVEGRKLNKYGVRGVENPDRFYEINALKIDTHIVKAIINPNPLDIRPYFGTSYELVPGSPWGRSLPEKMRDCQDAVNGCLRNLINNLALASGPMVVIDSHSVAEECDPTDVQAWKTYVFDSTRVANNAKAVDWFQPESNADVLTSVATYFENAADDRSLIPKFAHGESDVKGAGETFGGMSMLMNSAARGIRRVIGNIDQYVMRPLLEQLYLWNLKYLPDEQYADIKGDCRIVAKGALAILAKEQNILRLQEALDRTNNETDQVILGIRGRADMLRKLFEELELPEDAVPDEDELERWVQENMAMQQTQAEQQAQAEEAAAAEEAAQQRQPANGGQRAAR
jgi:hypothetical protein